MTGAWQAVAKVRLSVAGGYTRKERARYLDAEIQSLEDVLAQAKQLHNTTNPFASLPEEILLHIMLLHRDTTSSPEKADYIWTRIAEVCRRFRDIARAPVLFTKLSDHNLPPGLIARYLERSRLNAPRAPLSLTLGSRAYDVPSLGPANLLEDLAAHHLNRLQTLILDDHLHHEIYAKGKVVQRLLWPACHKLSQLKSLTINRYVERENEEVPHRRFIMPVDSDGHLITHWAPPPSLETLVLHITPFPWKCMIYDDLLSLTLRAVHIPSPDLVDLLSRMKRIDNLVLDRVKVLSDSAEALRSRGTYAPPASLKKWRISMDTQQKEDISSLLAFMHPSTSISYTIDLHNDPECLDNKISSFLVSHFEPHSSTPQELSARFGRWEDGSSKKTVLIRTAFCRTLERDAVPFMTITYTHASSLGKKTTGEGRERYSPSNYLVGNFRPTWAAIFPSFHMITQMELDCGTHYGPHELLRAFNCIPNVTTLHIRQDMLQPTLTMLVSPSTRTPMIDALHVIPSRYYGYQSYHDTIEVRLSEVGGTTREERARYLDAEIKSLETILAQAKQLHNTTNPFASLPEEILLHIMLLHRDTGPSFRNGEPIELWTGIIRVCRRFRDVARAPVLFTRLSDHNLPSHRIASYLERFRTSSPAALSLTLGAHHSNRLRSLVLDDHHLHEVYAKGKVVQQFLWPVWSKLSNLKSLAIHRYVEEQWERRVTYGRFIEPIDMDGLPIANWLPPPSLESLELLITPFPWRCAIYDNLLRLTLKMVHKPYPDLIGLLSRMRRIEHLTFDEVKVVAGETPGRWELPRTYAPPVSLKTWRVAFDTRKKGDCSPLLAFMQPSASISYVVDLHGDPGYLSNDLTNFLSEHFEQRVPLPPALSVHYSMKVQPGSDPEAKDMFHARTSFFRSSDRDAAPSVTVNYTHALDGKSAEKNKPPYKVSSYLIGLFKPDWACIFPSCHTVTELSLDFGEYYDAGDLLSAFKFFRSVTTLRVPEDMLEMALSVLIALRADVPNIDVLRVAPSERYGFQSSKTTIELMYLWVHTLRDDGTLPKDVRVPSALDAGLTARMGEGWRSRLAQ
ncbi:unnamed protein product [Peniophora sp. CBMAI 1063]|nr:unnamed protein product [Peniophora sp. CBMAI 1063]